jgi:hypothetical protein
MDAVEKREALRMENEEMIENGNGRKKVAVGMAWKV